MFVWIGLALLSASWLFGLPYYYQANHWAWAILVASGTAALATFPWRLPERRESLTALGLCLPALVLAPWPFRIALVLIALGLLFGALEPLRKVPRRFGGALLAAGCLLLAQAIGLIAYESVTARSHELPAPLASLLAGVAGLLNIDVSLHGTDLSVFSMRKIHVVGATWELLLDPATWCFAVGATLLIAVWNRTGRPPGRRWLFALRDVGLLLAAIAIWLPLRASLLIALFLHNVLLVGYDDPLDGMPLFWNGWMHLALLVGPVLLAWRLVARPSCVESPADEPPAKAPATPPPARWRRGAAAGLVGVAVALLVFAVYWDPVGSRLAGRVVVEEYHPNPEKIWERCDKPFDTEWYGHMSGYNYYCIVDYLSRYYDIARRDTPLDDAVLDGCDVLVLKVPSRPYSPQEIACVRRFVERGGGLLLIGEHTNVFGSGTYLNQVSQHFGFTFRYDCLFGIDSAFNQRLLQPLVPHPIVQHMPPMEFATSCSLAPGTSGRSVILSTGLKNLLADYHVDNYYPQPYNSAEMRYGAFVQLWSARSGKGRVVAFTDSTIFSNFCTFEPGKAELMLGMVEWLNRRTAIPSPRPWLALTALLALAGAAALMWRCPAQSVLLLGAGLLGWSVGIVGVRAAHTMTMPVPEPVRPMVRVATDQTVSKALLPKNGFIEGKQDGFGIFERWILRLGYFTARQGEAALFARDADSDAPVNDLVVIAYPGLPLSPESQRKVFEFRQKQTEMGQRAGYKPLGPDELRQQVTELRSKLERSAADLEDYRDALAEYVAAGGKVLLIDSPENEGSTANELLTPFGLSLGLPLEGGGQLQNTRGWPEIPVTAALEVEGGKPFATINGKPVGAAVAHGDGLVAVVGFGSRFSDAQMGTTGDIEPDEALREVFEVEFSLLRWIVEGSLPPTAATKQ